MLIPWTTLGRLRPACGHGDRGISKSMLIPWTTLGRLRPACGHGDRGISKSMLIPWTTLGRLRPACGHGDRGISKSMLIPWTTLGRLRPACGHGDRGISKSMLIPWTTLGRLRPACGHGHPYRSFRPDVPRPPSGNPRVDVVPGHDTRLSSTGLLACTTSCRLRMYCWPFGHLGVCRWRAARNRLSVLTATEELTAFLAAC